MDRILASLGFAAVGLAVFVLFLLGLTFSALASGSVYAQEEGNYWSVNTEVVDRLINLEKDLTQWSDELAGQDPATVRQALVQLNVCLRARNSTGAQRAVRGLRRLFDQIRSIEKPKTAENSEKPKIGEKAGANRIKKTDGSGETGETDPESRRRSGLQILSDAGLESSLRLAGTHDSATVRLIYESFPFQISAAQSFNVDALQGEDGQAWPDQKIADWIRARYQAALDFEIGETDPFRERFGGDGASRIWLRNWYFQLKKAGLLDDELARQEAAIARQPTDARRVLEYLDCLEQTSDWQTLEGPSSDSGESKIVLRRDLDAVLNPVALDRATDNSAVAATLTRLQRDALADRFLVRALEIPVTDDEVRVLLSACSALLPDETHRIWFQVRTMEQRVECLTRLGDKTGAQNLMVEAAEIRKARQLPTNFLLAGTVQAFSGQRVIENQIREQEKATPEDPKYWRDRAQYYRGRQERRQEEEALRKGLQLCGNASHKIPIPDKIAVQTEDLRPELVLSLARLLLETGREAQSVELVETELAKAPVGSVLSNWLVSFRRLELSKSITWDNPVLWDFLARNPDWEFSGVQVVWDLLKRTPPDQREAQYRRAETLARTPKPNPNRLAPLGWVENRMGEPGRSLPLLKEAVELWERDGDLSDYQDRNRIQSADFTIFESYLDLGDWRSAEAHFSRAQKQLTADEKPRWLDRVADKAEQADDLEDAKRIRKRVANTGER